jgi:hypothetical protein
MADNALRIGLDPLYPPPSNFQNKKLTKEQNRFELVFDEL